MKLLLLCILLVLPVAFLAAQPVYFHQTFTEAGNYVNPQPDTGQFSHIILTAPALSYHKFRKGYMELARTLQDSATGGIIRALRAEPFMPAPQALVVRITLSAEQIQSVSPNALYFYIGEHFNPVNNAFPGNDLMFGKVSLHFLGDNFVIKDLQTQAVSKPVPPKTPVTITWVLNNSDQPLSYEIPGKQQLQTVAVSTYDLWADNVLVGSGIPAYPMHAPFSATKLSNFEMRFRNGVGKIRIYEILIQGLNQHLAIDRALIVPNPSSPERITLHARNLKQGRIQLERINGQKVGCSVIPASRDTVSLLPDQPLVPGIYLVRFEDIDGQRHTLRVMVE